MKSELISSPIAAESTVKNRPFWSVMIPTFNCAKYLQQTLESVLTQDPGAERMQIEVVDDGSTEDDPEVVVERVAGDRVTFHRNPVNLGAVQNFNACIQRACGRWIHILHGDDYIQPGFYECFEKAIQQRGDIDICACRSFFIDESGLIRNLSPDFPNSEIGGTFLAPLRHGCPIQTPSVVVRKAFYEKYGGFDVRLKHSADWEMWIRAFNYSRGIFINQPLACYRVFQANDSSRLARTGDNVRDYILMHQVLEERGIHCDIRGFRNMCLQRVIEQEQYFDSIQNVEAARNNRDLWYELATPIDRIIYGARIFKSTLQRFL